MARVPAAVEQKIDDQAEFVTWWGEKARKGGRPKGKTSPDRRWFSQEEAETHTGIRHQQVSKWVARLEDRAKYRELLYGVAYRKAMGEVDLRVFMTKSKALPCA